MTFVAIVNSFVAKPSPTPISFSKISMVPIFILVRTHGPPLVYKLESVSLSTLPFTFDVGALIQMRSKVPPECVMSDAW